MNTTTQQNGTVDVSGMSTEKQIEFAVTRAAEAAKGVEAMLGWKHRLVNAAGAGLIGGAVVLTGLGVYNWLSSDAPAGKPSKA